MSEHLAEDAARVGQNMATLRRVWGDDFKRGRAPQNLSGSQFMALAMVAQITGAAEHVGPWTPDEGDNVCTIGRLAGVMGLTPGTVVRIVDSLEQKGLIARERGQADRRLVTLTLTAAGLRIRQDMQEKMRDRMVAILRGLSAEERDTLLAGMDTMVLAVTRWRGEG